MKTIFKFGAVALAASSLGGCLIVDADVRENDFGGFGGGLLYGAEVSVRGPSEISIVVHSNGCTQKEDFSADVNRDDGRYRVRFEREKKTTARRLCPKAAA